MAYHIFDEEKYAPYTTLLKIGSTSVVLKNPYLRRSYQSKRKVSEIIATAFPQTALLAVVALTFALIGGVLLGVLSALYKDSWIDRLTLVLSTLGMSLPSFFAAILIAWFFAYVLADVTHLNMFGNLYTVDDYGTGHSNIVNLHNWSMGSFSGITWNNVSVMIVVVGVALVLSMFLAKPMDAYRLGEEYASNLGVNVKLFRVMLILISSILAATVTAFAGPVSFVGIAVPHLMKRLFGYSKPIIMVPACFMGGAVFCLFSDLVARTIFAPTEISISSVTAILGAPIVIMMLIGRKREVNE